MLLGLVSALATVPLSFRPAKPATATSPAKPSRSADPALPPVDARIPAEGYDANHRRLPFTIYVLSQQLSWKLASSTALEQDGTLVDSELEAGIQRARYVFCIGTASREGGTGREEMRAARRAECLAGWVRSVIRGPRAARLILLNAGQYQGRNTTASAGQRKAILITAEGSDEGVNLGQALASGLEKKQEEYPVVRSLLHDYSRSRIWLNFLAK